MAQVTFRRYRRAPLGALWRHLDSDSLLEHARVESGRLEASDGLQRDFFSLRTAVDELNAEYRDHVLKEERAIPYIGPSTRSSFMRSPTRTKSLSQRFGGHRVP